MKSERFFHKLSDGMGYCIGVATSFPSSVPFILCPENIKKRGDYSLWGWFLLSFGVTAIPKRIEYRCRVCRELFAMSVDPADLQREAP